jgi:tetratricopeptide (TPR) repeat protein
MGLGENSEKKEIKSRKDNVCPHCGASIDGQKAEKRKKWYDRTSVTLCVAAGLIVIGFGFIHVITGVVSPYNLPFDIVLKESFGYRETFVRAEKIKALPYEVAKIKYPLGCKALQRSNYMDFGDGFEARMTRRLRENFNQWREEFDRTVNMPQQQWQDQLQNRLLIGRVDPEDPNAYNSRGIAAAREGRYEAALSAFTRAFQRDPEFAEAYYNHGMVSVAIGLLGQGASDFSKVIEINPELIDGYEKRGSLYFAMKQYDEAILDFTKIIELDPMSARATFKRSLAYYAKGQYDLAREDIHKIQNLGLPVPQEYLKMLRLVSK